MADETDDTTSTEGVTSNFRPYFAADGTTTAVNLGENTLRLTFGITDAQADYNTPVMRFSFFDASGNERTVGGPVPIYIRMTSSFETVLANPYQEQEGIFGSPVSATDKGALGKITGILESGGKAGIEAVKKQILAGIGATGGFIASAGASGISQTEFLTRQFFNNFQQLIYKGPQFRRFSPSFTMRPTSYDEALSMKRIISLFRFVSSPRAGIVSALGEVPKAEETVEKNNSPDVDISYFKASDSAEISGGSQFTFGYPDTCEMEIFMLKGGVPDSIANPIFKSQLCVIESVNVTYGSQNKMTFFKPNEKSDPVYFPTEVILQLQLRELVLISADQTVLDLNDDYRTIL